MPAVNKYWIRVTSMAPIEDEVTATQMIRDSTSNRVIYVESEDALQMNEAVHAAWAALIKWHNTGEISGVSVKFNPFEMRSITPQDPPSNVLDDIVHLPLTLPRLLIELEKCTDRLYWIRIVDLEPIDRLGHILAPRCGDNYALS